MPIPYVFGGIGVASIAVAVPFILRWVPMNRWYGVRTRKAFASDEAWYEINAFGGKAFFVFGLLLVAVAWFGRNVLPAPRDASAAVVMALPALAGGESVYYGTMEKFGVDKRDILVDRVEGARKAQQEAKEQFSSALEKFIAVTPIAEADKFIAAMAKDKR